MLRWSPGVMLRTASKVREGIMSEVLLDTTRVEAFGRQMGDVLNHATLALLMSIGHQVSLFDTLAVLPPATSHEIAGAAGLQERYVREWLGGVRVARVVEY